MPQSTTAQSTNHLQFKAEKINQLQKPCKGTVHAVVIHSKAIEMTNLISIPVHSFTNARSCDSQMTSRVSLSSVSVTYLGVKTAHFLLYLYVVFHTVCQTLWHTYTNMVFAGFCKAVGAASLCLLTISVTVYNDISAAITGFSVVLPSTQKRSNYIFSFIAFSLTSKCVCFLVFFLPTLQGEWVCFLFLSAIRFPLLAGVALLCKGL